MPVRTTNRTGYSREPVQFVLAIEVLWYDPLFLSVLTVSFSQSHCLLSIPLFSPQQLEAKWDRRNVWARFVRIERKKRARETDRWREGNEKKEIERRRKEWRQTILIGLCGHVELRWSGPAKPCVSVAGLALHASRAFGQPQLTPVCSLAVSNVKAGGVLPPTSTLCSTVQKASLIRMNVQVAFAWFIYYIIAS